tara:strand:- start:421 stop:891 length:471 start_codon:yes stop_codon:yes gene_type:complete
MMKDKFIIICVFSLFITGCSISNPLKKETKIIVKDCPQSLILYQSRALDLDNATIELPLGYKFSCNLIENEGVVEILTDYSLNVSLKEEGKKIYQVDLIIFVTDKSEEIIFEEFRFPKELNIQNEKQKNLVFNFTDRIKIDSDIYNSGIKLYYALN